MMLVFPDDRATWSISDQYMIGDSLLVAPILTPVDPQSESEPAYDTATTARQVYLPAGDWYDVWTVDAAPIKGPQTITVSAPFGRPPVFSRGEAYTGLLDPETVPAKSAAGHRVG